MDNTRPVRTNTADRAPHTLVTQGYVRVLVCTVCSSVEHSYQPGTFQCTSSCNNRLRCRWIPQRTIKLRVAWQVMDNTRPVRTNTADRAPHTLTTQGYVRVLVCTVCFQWNIRTNPVHSSAHRVVTTDYGDGGYPQQQPKLRVA